MQAQLPGDARQLRRQRPRVQTAGIRYDPDLPVETFPHDLLHLLEECRYVAAVRLLALGPKEDRHGQFREIIAGEEINRPPLDHLLGGTEPIPEKPAAVGDDDFVVFLMIVHLVHAYPLI